ncbi:hypothetical protein PGT21_020391 [Puccinia graminis f. sp. tritici]|uniref:Uncharacterized protein n=1 Tax=Puccinia graminis f. sp. tritici TaxID=56615 RepID=A0A5B0QND7_PUCGR|nr:hypothetical protein PGT21_020391 [Puccinia graminis f. sp. tritici]
MPGPCSNHAQFNFNEIINRTPNVHGWVTVCTTSPNVEVVPSSRLVDIAYPYARTEVKSKFNPCDSRLKIFIALGTTIVATC